MRLIAGSLVTTVFASIVALPAWGEVAPLAITAKLPLPDGKGRIDHLAFDEKRHRLFVAELGNDAVAVVDVSKLRLVGRLENLNEPQGIAYFAATDTVYVASGGDGKLRAYRAGDLGLVGSVDVGNDADNVRVDEKAGRVYVAHGDGALAVLDAGTLAHVGEISLKGHPESFQLSGTDARVYVNVPDSREVAVLDRGAGKQVGSWPTETALANFPMALDEANGEVISVFRAPAKIVAYRVADGAAVRTASVCGDADDVFVDVKRRRVYVICGEGFVDVLEAATLARTGRIATTAGARTGYFSADANLLFVAVRAGGGNAAAVWVLTPTD